MVGMQRSITVQVDLDSEALREDVRRLLFEYSEWLDSEGVIRTPEESEGDHRSHDGLVREFMDRSKSAEVEMPVVGCPNVGSMCNCTGACLRGLVPGW